MQRTLIIIGVVVLAVGLAWPLIAKLGLGRLPGDIHISSGSGDFYFPIVTSIIVSIVISLVLWIFRR